MLNSTSSVVDKAVAGALDALPRRLSVREMAAAAGVSLWSLQQAFGRAHCLTPVAHVQQLCLEHARRDLEHGAAGDTVFAIARRWGFSSPDGAFGDGYRARYGERPSDTLKRARKRLPQRAHPAEDDGFLACLECGRKLRRLHQHLLAAHGLTAAAYRQRWGLHHRDPLVCTEMSRKAAACVLATDLADKGASARRKWKGKRDVARHDRIDGDALPPSILVARAEALVLAALPDRLSERYLAERLGVGLRTLRRAFLDERGDTAYVALRRLRLQEAQRRVETDPILTLEDAARQCGFGHVARFRRDLDALREMPDTRSHPVAAASGAVQEIGNTRLRRGSLHEPQRATV